MKKIKILRIIARLNIGGPAIHTILLTAGLDQEHFETVLVTGSVAEGEAEMDYLAQEKGVRPVVIAQLSRALNLGHDLFVLSKLFSLMRQERPDLIHTHTAKAGTLGRLAGLLYKASRLAGWLVCRLQGKKAEKVVLIHTFHGHVLHSYFGKLKSWCFLWIERILGLFTTRIIAVSENLRKELLAYRIAPQAKIITVPLGLELEKHLRTEATRLKVERPLSIGTVGRLVPIKNQRMFLEAAQKINALTAMENKLQFFVIGDGPLRAELEDYAQELGIRDQVTFTGWVKDLGQYYDNLDVVTLTSLNEGTPVALIEAQAQGRPCVATNVGGVANVVEDGKSGFLVPSGDTEQFVTACMKLLQDPGLMQEMGSWGRKKVIPLFSKERLIKDIEQLYVQELS